MKEITIGLIVAVAFAAGQTNEMRGKQMLQHAQAFMGGTDKLLAVKDVIQTEQITFEPSAGGFKMNLASSWIVPDQLRMEMETPSGRTTAYIARESGWQTGPQGVEPIPPDELKEEAQGELFRQPVTLMLSDRNTSRSVIAVSNDAVKISSGGQTARVEFDLATGRPIRLLFNGHEAGSRMPTAVVLTFSDWRPAAGGIRMPYKIVQHENGAKKIETVVSEYRFTVGLTSALLSRKP